MNFYTCFQLVRKMADSLKGVTQWLWGRHIPFRPSKGIIMRINLIAFIATITFLNASANVYAQRITLKAKDASLETVFAQIKKQSGYFFWYEKDQLQNAGKVTLDLKDADLKEALDACFEGHPFEYSIKEKMIVVKPKPQKSPTGNSSGQQDISGKVVDENREPLSGASVKIKGSSLATTADNQGNFRFINAPDNAVLIVSYIGFENREILASANMTITLARSTSNLEEVQVVNTGYQQLPKERATGSFVQIDNELFNRKVGTNVLDRLDGVTSGLIFNKTLSNNGSRPKNETIGISIRGRSTIDAKVSADPLIVIDNFPYEGTLDNINPNDVESITVLKDAAAASIWGARSGNGVVVITTKKGKFGQPLKIAFNSNFTFGEKPDQFYTKNYLPSRSYIEIETYLFNQGTYNTNLNNTTTFPLVSPVVEILAKKRAGTITAADADIQLNALGSIDSREQIEQYFFRNSLKQQYALNLFGGSEKIAYNFSAGYDNNMFERLSNYSRFNINASNTIRPIKNLEITTGIIYSEGKDTRSKPYTPIYPYTRVADDNGNALAVPIGFRSSYIESTKALGFLDWQFKPLEEQQFVDYTDKTTNILIRASVGYSFLKSFRFSAQYQYEDQKDLSRNYQSMDTYYTRDLINRYSQRSGTGVFTYPIPKGGILDLSQNILAAHNFRSQLNYDKILNEKHSITALIGGEIRSRETEGSASKVYGYDDQLGTGASNLNYATTFPLNPSGLGSQLIPAASSNIIGTTNRFISYYANAAYSYDGRYTFSLSGRKDGANIFGVKTNDKITPLWSAGLAWTLDREEFYKFDLIPKLKLRATYGFNGNVYNASAYLTALYSTNSLNGNQMATVSSAPNALLRWEKIRNVNIGIDFSSKKDVITGSIEFYQKYASDLIEDAPLAPSSGFTTFKGNAAAMKTNGIDLILASKNLSGALQWQTNFLMSLQKDKVVRYDTEYNALSLARFDNSVEPAANGIFPVIGNSLFGIYSFRSAGLDPVNGDPLGYLNGQVSKDYTNIINNTPVSGLVYHGSSRPNIFGSLRNTFEYKGISLSFNITYKFDYYFRRKSINLNYTQLLANVHSDYSLRWQNPGDELTTTVPSLVFAANTNRNLLYRSSDVLVERGDHIRLQDIGMDYNISRNLWKNSPFKLLQVYAYANNIAILWRANKQGIDPDINDLSFGVYPVTKTISVGIRGQF